MLEVLKEAKDLGLYKGMVEVLHAYDEKMPGSAVGKVLSQVMDIGMKVLPKDKKALEILGTIFADGDFVYEHRVVTSSVSKLLNARFSDMAVKPMYFDNKDTKKVAYWRVGDKISDRVLSLLRLDGAEAGYWTDEKGNKVKLA